MYYFYIFSAIMEKTFYFCRSSMKQKKKIVHYVMLVASIMMLISVVVPHHHHSNGLPCYKWLSTETTHGGHGSENPHDYSCNGHNVALYTSVQSHVLAADVSQLLFPLLILFDYINPPEPDFLGQLFESGPFVYIESLHDTWFASASGLRAPPVL